MGQNSCCGCSWAGLAIQGLDWTIFQSSSTFCSNVWVLHQHGRRQNPKGCSNLVLVSSQHILSQCNFVHLDIRITLIILRPFQDCLIHSIKSAFGSHNHSIQQQ